MGQETMSTLLVAGGIAQIVVAAAMFVFGLMIQNNVRKMKDEIMTESRREFVSTAVATQQQANTNLLLRNLTETVDGLRTDVVGLGKEVAALKVKIDRRR
jgi:uncharacterized protein YoxC